MNGYLPFHRVRPNWPFILRAVRLLTAIIVLAVSAGMYNGIARKAESECPEQTSGVVLFHAYLAFFTAALLIFPFGVVGDNDIRHCGHVLMNLFSAIVVVGLTVSFCAQVIMFPIGWVASPTCLWESRFIQGYTIAWLGANIPVLLMVVGGVRCIGNNS
jgi:hypothetical protein